MTNMVVKFLVLILCFVACKAANDDGNTKCYTDQSYFGYKKLYFSHWDLYSNRPKCDAERHFGLTVTFKTNRRSSTNCLKLDRKWWAIQIIPQGDTPTFSFDSKKFKLKSIQCLDNEQKKTETAKGLTHEKYELHNEGEICMKSTKRNVKQKFDVYIVTKPLDDDPTPGIQTYQSPRFECQYKTKGAHCIVKHPDVATCDDSF